MRCVVTSLTEDGPSDLAEELARGEALQVYDHSPHEVDAENWQTWTPDPVDADPCKSHAIDNLAANISSFSVLVRNFVPI